MRQLTLLLALCARATADWIDPDTPLEALTAHSYVAKPPPPHTPPHHSRGTPSPTASLPPTDSPSSSPSQSPTTPRKQFDLVFSDEFRWTALNKNDYTNDALHYYSPNNVRTDDGHLVITTKAQDTHVVGYDDTLRERTHVTKHFTSAMVQSWNKFCFTGGIIEAEVVLPGESDIGGLWPAFWILGNLARHTYVGSSQHVWPWSSVECSRKTADSQALSGCRHNTHFGLQTSLGRGAPEIDIFEVQAGDVLGNTGPFLKTWVGQPFMSSSFQVAPGRPFNRPGPGDWPGPGQWYEGLTGGKNTSLNILFYGNYNHFRGDPHPERQDYWSDAISFNRQLEEDHFRKPHVYRLEWDVPSGDNHGYLRWFLDGELVLDIDGVGLSMAGQGAEVSSEPSYIILNTAVSSQWGFPSTCPSGCPCKTYDCHSDDWHNTCGFSTGFCEMMLEEPPEYKINWVRVYQDPNDPLQKVGCSTPERPTRQYIQAHESLYKTADDAHPLLKIQRGQGPCNPRVTNSNTLDTCGGPERGRCLASSKTCECMPGWTGPHCLAHQGYDPILYDEPDHITDVGFVPPRTAPRFLVCGMGLLFLLLVVVGRYRKSLDYYSPIPEVEFKRSVYHNGTNGTLD
jgi:beta-glucan synthesis-associated protein KRE6